MKMYLAGISPQLPIYKAIHRGFKPRSKNKQTNKLTSKQTNKQQPQEAQPPFHGHFLQHGLEVISLVVRGATQNGRIGGSTRCHGQGMRREAWRNGGNMGVSKQQGKLPKWMVKIMEKPY